jgi:hypothetical protein
VKHIILFSGGCGSAYTAYLAKEKYGKNNITLLHTETKAEDPDTLRFMNAVSCYLDIPLTFYSDGRSLWDLIDEYKAIPNQKLPFCTTQLKQRQTDKYCNKLKKENIDYVLHLGYGIEEQRRVQRSMASNEHKGRKTEFLLFKSLKSNMDIKKIIVNEWKICLPSTYRILKHNNCLPCFKGGKEHFRKIWKYYPEKYKMAEEREIKYHHTVFNNISLRELREQFENNTQLTFFEDDTLSNKQCVCFL